MKISVLLLMVACSQHLSNQAIQHYNSTECRMMAACASYISTYRPLYHHQGESYTIARFNIPPDSINNYLIRCAEENNFKPLKYAAALMIRHNVEYGKSNHGDYLISDGLIVNKNGFIVLLRHAMNEGSLHDDFSDAGYWPQYTGEACQWINNNKAVIDDFQYVEQYLKSLE